MMQEAPSSPGDPAYKPFGQRALKYLARSARGTVPPRPWRPIAGSTAPLLLFEDPDLEPIARHFDPGAFRRYWEEVAQL